MLQTEDFYDRNARVFIERTQDVDMGELYAKFLPLVPSGGRILDAGCGSGRDSKAFLSLGFDVVSIDKSQAMVEATGALTGRPALRLAFEDIQFNEEFDAIWASASLLHVEKAGMEEVLSRILAALKPGGVLYMSFKRGEGERRKDGRFFNDYTEQSIRSLLDRPDLTMETVWLTMDARPDRDEEWVNALVRKASD